MATTASMCRIEAGSQGFGACKMSLVQGAAVDEDEKILHEITIRMHRVSGILC